MAFARRICEDQVAICNNEFWNAPCGKESNIYRHHKCPMCTDNKLYNDMMQWWDKLEVESIKKLQSISKMSSVMKIWMPVMTFSTKDSVKYGISFQ